MTRKKWRTALVGFGRIAAGYAEDLTMAKHYRYCTHAQVLRDHPRLKWNVVIEQDQNIRQVAIRDWKAPIVVSSIDELGASTDDIDIVVLATPPSARLGIVEKLPHLRAMLVEKPLGVNLSTSIAFLKECSERNLLVQVNFWRRADRGLRALASGGLSNLVGEPMVVNCLYGNGLLNNGSHIIDLARMLFGEVNGFKIIDPGSWSVNGPIPGDINPAFSLSMTSGLVITFAPIDFRKYRENGMIIWGSEGRLDILNEGLVLRHFPVGSNRAMSGEHEIATDLGVDLKSTVGDALYCMYDNLIDALEMGDSSMLQSSGESAYVTTRWVDHILSEVNSSRGTQPSHE